MKKNLLSSLAFAVILGTTLNGCSLINDTFTKGPAFISINEAKEQINQADTIANIFDTKNIHGVTKSSDEDYMFDDSHADAYNFPTGKSFFHVFELPLNTPYLAISFSALISTTTFLPRVDFYNKDHRLVSSMKSTAFKFRDSQLGSGYLVGKVIINNAAAKPSREFAYMVVYTTDEAQESKTAAVNPQIKQAIALRNDIPSNAPDIMIPHSPLGEVNITFAFREQEESFAENIINYLDAPLIGGKQTSNRQENVVLASGEVYSVSSQTEGSTTVTSTDSRGNSYTPEDPNKEFMASNVTSTQASSTQTTNSNGAAMLKETEEFYNSLIKKAVASGDISKAMNLVGEAERAGSFSAQQTFIEAVQQMNHK